MTSIGAPRMWFRFSRYARFVDTRDHGVFLFAGAVQQQISMRARNSNRCSWLGRSIGRNPHRMLPSSTMIFRFGLFELDTDSEELLKDGRTVKIQQQPYKLLCLLITQAGKVVSRDDIRAALWPADTFVDYDQGVNF